MRVAYVCADAGIPVFGAKGASIHVQAVVRELHRRGHEVHLVARRIGGQPPADLADVTLHHLPPVGGAGPAERELALLDADTELARILETHGPFDLVYERYSLWSAAGIAHARAAGVPSVLEVNAPLIDEQARHRQLVHRDRASTVAAAVIGEATATVAVSQPVAEWAGRWAHDPSRVHVVPNGVDLARVAPQATPRACDGFTVGFVGTLKPWHGVDVLLDAVTRLAGDWRLVLVGDGPERAALASQARRLGIEDRVHTIGAVAPDAVGGHLAAFDVAVAPYPVADDDYFSPLKVFEYLAAGLPVVASATGQIPSILTHGVDGVLVPPGDPVALGAALSELQGDPERRAHLGRAARHTAESRHGWDRVVDRTLAAAGCPLRAPSSLGATA